MKIAIAFILSFASLGAFAKSYDIEMSNKTGKESMLFNPYFLKLEVGDVVNFVPKSKGHNTKSLLIPEGAKPWKGKNNQAITVQLNVPGYYIYRCSNHFSMGMIGVLVVGNGANKNEALEKLTSLKKKIFVNKPRVDKLIKLVDQ
jgi:pseudoazurin